MGGKKQSSRGFFFTILALTILTFMLFIVQIWVATFEKADQRASQRFKAEAMRMTLYTLSDKALSNFANASAFHAMHRLTLYASNVSNPLPWRDSASTDPRNPHTDNVTQSIYLLMTVGNATPSGALLDYSSEEKQSYTLRAWQGRIREAANVMGFNAIFSNATNFSVRQRDEWTVDVYFEIEMNITDLERTMHQGKKLHANTSFPINGFRDAFVSRMDASQRCNGGSTCVDFVERQVFRNETYATASDLAPALVSHNPPYISTEGNGWFYGPMISDYPDLLNATEIAVLSQYVLVRGWDENLSRYADMYGAVIVTELPLDIVYNITDAGCPFNVTEQTRCLNCLRRYSSNVAGCARGLEMVVGTNISKPLLEINSNAWRDEIWPVRRAGLPDEKYVLIDNTYSEPIDKFRGDHKLWDLNKARDASVCGLYVKGRGPSFFQRMLSDAQLLNNNDLGIESLVVGTWAGGANDSRYSIPALPQWHEDLSRVDWEFYRGLAGVKIKGMPGCKILDMCGSTDNNATRQSVGRFRLTGDSMALYGMLQIGCNYTANAPCE